MINEKEYIQKDEKKFLENAIEEILLKDEIEKYLETFEEKERLPDLLGKTVKVSKKQYPKIYKIVEYICEVLELEYIDVYIFEDFYYGVESKGIKKNWIEISAKTIEDFTEGELMFLLGKELYNIKFKNTYNIGIMKQGIRNLSEIRIVGNDITVESLKLLVYKWHRVMNFSSDNFGYSICGNLKDAINAMLLTILNNRNLVVNIDILEYINQSNLIDALNDEIYNNTKLDEMVPYGPYRIKNLIGYASSLRAKKGKVRGANEC